MSLTVQDLEDDKDAVSLWIVNDRAEKGYGPVLVPVSFHGTMQQVVIKETRKPQNLVEQIPSRASILKSPEFRNLVNARYVRALTDAEVRDLMASQANLMEAHAEYDEAASFYGLKPGDPGYVG